MYSKKVVITGLGAVTPVGNSVSEFWHSLINSLSGVARIKRFATGNFRPGYAAEVKDFSPERAGLPRRKLKTMGRHSQLALAAALEAASDAGLADSPVHVSPERVGIMLGVGMLSADEAELGRAFYATQQAKANTNGDDADQSFDMVSFGRAGAPQLFPLFLLRHIPNMACAHGSIALDARGVSNTITTGCVASANAIGEAARAISRGEADVILAGGTDARVSPLGMLRYKGLGWLAARDDVDPTTVSAPFDVSAEGFVNGEGAALLVLESLDHARERGARVYAELVGYGAANDAYDMLVPHPEGRGLERAIKSCLSRSSTAASELDAIFAPANSVPAFDRASAMAIRTICGRSGKRPRITATRSILGHTHAASAALDCIAAVKAINDKQLPAAVNLRNPIEDLDFVTARQQCADISRVMVAAYGFGGHAAAVMLGRPGL